MNKRLFFACLMACLALSLVGFIVGAMADLPKSLIPASVQPNTAILSKVRNTSTFATIFLNNSRVFAAMVVGILTCGLLSIFELLMIGAMVGFLYRITSQQGFGVSLIGASMAPHGVFELTSFFMVGAVGLYFAVRLYGSMKGQAIDWQKEARAYALVVAGAYGVMTFAAVLETYLTPYLLEKLLR